MAIIFKPFEELFASAYQLIYISVYGDIGVGPNTYSVFTDYTMIERQAIFQVCEKHLPWEDTQEQEQWERTQYMYQFIIKSPPPFPYPEYELSEEIIMALTLTELFEKQGDSVFRNKVDAACWRHAKTLLATATPTTGELKLASKLLTGQMLKEFTIAAAVLINDGIADDPAIESAVVVVATKLVALEV